MLKRIWKNKSGASLIEVLIAIVILGMVVVPLGSSFVLSVRLNTRSRALMQEQNAVSNAVEQLMARGIDKVLVSSDGEYLDPGVEEFQKVTILVSIPGDEEESAHSPAYPVTVTYAAPTENGTPYSLDTVVRWVPTPDPEEGG